MTLNNGEIPVMGRLRPLIDAGIIEANDVLGGFNSYASLSDLVTNWTFHHRKIGGLVFQQDTGDLFVCIAVGTEAGTEHPINDSLLRFVVSLGSGQIGFSAAAADASLDTASTFFGKEGAAFVRAIGLARAGSGRVVRGGQLVKAVATGSSRITPRVAVRAGQAITVSGHVLNFSETSVDLGITSLNTVATSFTGGTIPSTGGPVYVFMRKDGNAKLSASPPNLTTGLPSSAESGFLVTEYVYLGVVFYRSAITGGSDPLSVWGTAFIQDLGNGVRYAGCDAVNPPSGITSITKSNSGTGTGSPQSFTVSEDVPLTVFPTARSVRISHAILLETTGSPAGATDLRFSAGDATYDAGGLADTDLNYHATFMANHEVAHTALGSDDRKAKLHCDVTSGRVFEIKSRIIGIHEDLNDLRAGAAVSSGVA